LRRSPGVTAAAVLALALGIGANTAIFSVVDNVLLRPLPYPNSQDLMYLSRSSSKFNFRNAPFSYLNFNDLQAQNRVFENVGVWADGDINLSRAGGAPERAHLKVISPSLLPTLQVSPIVGRNF